MEIGKNYIASWGGAFGTHPHYEVRFYDDVSVDTFGTSRCFFSTCVWGCVLFLFVYVGVLIVALVCLLSRVFWVVLWHVKDS